MFVVPLDESQEWYRYHHLFADLLRHLVREREPEIVPELYTRASQWYEDGGMVDEAIEHAWAAGDVVRAARLLDEHMWHYSSGTSNIVSQVVCDAVGGTPQDGLAFPRQELFERIGMRSTVFEPDASGTPVGASYAYATARDWARFGLLYLQDGVWEGERILPEGWVTYTTTSTPGSEGLYGAHWWLNSGDGHGWYWPDDLPEVFMADGHDGQFIIVVPSHNLVIVRLAFTQDPEAFNLGAFVEHVVEAIPESQ